MVYVYVYLDLSTPLVIGKKLLALITPDEIISFAKNNINERAACPKEIFILDALPVTAVAKIHKPSLREMAVKYVVEESLAEVIALADVNIETKYAKSGQMYVTVKADKPSDQIKAVLDKLQSELKLVINLV